jgi:hypothetical protein
MIRRSVLLPAILFLLMGSLAIAQEQSGVADRLLEDLKSETDTSAKREVVSPQSWRDFAEEMRRISRQLPQVSAAKETLTAQSELIEELTKRLAKAQTGSSSSISSPSLGGDQKSQAAAGEAMTAKGDTGQGSAATGKGPATKAGALGKSGSSGGEGAKGMDTEVLVRRAWGQLPSRVRDRLQAGTPEKFHEKYKTETESYFRRLSEMEHRP